MADFSQVTIQPGSPQLLGQAGEPVLLYNSSATVSVALGSDPLAVDPTDTTSTAPLPPLATVVLDGSRDVWGITSGGTAQVTVIPGGLHFFQLVELLVKTLLVSASAGNGVFVYSGTPALGDLIASIAAAAGHDPYGNTVVQGIADYSGTAIIQMNGGTLSFGLTTDAGLAGLIAGGGKSQLTSGTVGAGDVAPNLQLISKNASDGGQEVLLVGRLITPLVVAARAPGTLSTVESWHSLGALGAHYTVTLGRYKLTENNELELDIKVVGDGLQATSVTFANTLPAAYRPATQHDSLPMGTTRAVTAGDISPRLLVDTLGNVTVTNQGTANTFAFAGRIPLD